jgi:hypothetical protein
MPRLNQKQYAKHRGVKPQYISRLVREGRIAVGRDHLIDAEKADKALGPRVKAAAKRAPRAAAKPRIKALPRESSTATLTAARARKATADAELAELQVGHERGLLLHKDEVLQAQRQQNANIRTRLRMLPRAFAQQLAAITSPAEIERLALEIIDRELSDLARDPLALQTYAEPEPQSAVASESESQ